MNLYDLCSFDDRGAHRRCCLNMGFCNIGADGITISICNSMWLLFGQTSFNLAFGCYLYHQFFNWASVPGGRFSNSPNIAKPCSLCVTNEHDHENLNIYIFFNTAFAFHSRTENFYERVTKYC